MADIGMILPDAPWRRRAQLDQLCDVLGGDEMSRFVGGAVRDTLLGINVDDVDIATRLSPDEVLARLKAKNIRAVPTGLAHGTITAVIDSGPVEVTTLRRDVSTDGRHATIAYTDDWREDAARRDFTINALYAEPVSGQIHDYFNGLRDLEDRRIRFIGDPLTRIAEDHLRILRFFRFLARFGDTPDPEGLNACIQRANDLMALSRERIAAELTKLLVAKDAVRVVGLMQEKGIFQPVLPEVGAQGVEHFARLVRREQTARVAPDAIRRLVALLPPDPEIAEAVASRLKLSNAQRKRMALAAAPPELPPHALAYIFGTVTAIDKLLIGVRSDSEVVESANLVKDWTAPVFPLRGGDLIAMGVERGPDVARLLQQIERQWIEEHFPDEARVSDLARQAVNHWLVARNKA